ncbi:MAG: exonuclease domain-containing protein [Clostridia bacterium]|nr:exonuclease domain-containing protein [Clostridia bacterium]
MNYIIFDLELNSKPFKNRHPNEIIEIGAVKLNSDLKNEGVFQAFVKPKIYKKLFTVVKRKTKITQEDINEADGFKDVLARFKQWIEDDYILCSWGHDDIHHLKANCEFNKRGIKWLKKNMDIQKHFSKIYEAPPGQRYSLKNALEVLDINVQEELHRAEIDAMYTAEIFVKIFNRIDIEAACVL